MAFDWAGLATKVDAAIGAQWPEVLATGIYEYDEIARISLERLATLPFAAYEFATIQIADWGVVNIAYEARLHVHYVAPISTGAAGVRAKLEALKVAFLTGALDPTTVVEVESLDWSGRHPAQAVFYGHDIAVICGMLSAVLVVGETLQ